MNLLPWLEQSDVVAQLTAGLLLAMSITSWIVLLCKAWQLRRAQSEVARSVAAFWQAPDWPAALQQLPHFDRQTLVLPLVQAAQTVRPIAARPENTAATLSARGSLEQQLTRVLRDALHAVVAKLQWGQVLLATVGSTAPFVGLLGTVWGIYHALSALAGASTVGMERVSGPVGEALVMTAAGLVVAIPAVLGYNVFGRRVASIEADLEGFAHDLRTWRLDEAAEATGSLPSRRAPPAAFQADANAALNSVAQP